MQLKLIFTIVEPYGMTLLDRLLSACSMPPVNSPNYIDQPYLLEIDFLANVDEAGQPIASSYAALAAKSYRN